MTFEKATESFNKMGALLKELGIDESEEKAEGMFKKTTILLTQVLSGPRQEINYLGITYNTVEGTIQVREITLHILNQNNKPQGEQGGP